VKVPMIELHTENNHEQIMQQATSVVGRQLSVVSTCVHGQAQTPLVRFVVDIVQTTSQQIDIRSYR